MLPHVVPLFFGVSPDNLPNKKSTTFPAWANCLYFWAAAGHVHGDCCRPAYFADNNPRTFNGPFDSCHWGPSQFKHGDPMMAPQETEILHIKLFLFRINYDYDSF